MSLRARKPEPVNKRLKIFMFGPAGVDSWEKMSGEKIEGVITLLKQKKRKSVKPLAWDEFADKAAIVSRLKNIGNDWHNEAMSKFIDHNGGEPEKIPSAALAAALAAMERGTFDYATGVVKEPVAA